MFRRIARGFFDDRHVFGIETLECDEEKTQ